MGKEKKRVAPGPAPGGHAKERHKKALRNKTWGAPMPRVLNARPEVPNLKSKHHSYYELVENKDKKKKLEFQITGDRKPPPGFEFVPIGNPELTTACKEISREQDAMIFIVSTTKGAAAGSLSHHMNRIGHHIRQSIVEQARLSIGGRDDPTNQQHLAGVPEPIPETQEEINEQADKAIRDLFPRIPHADRQTIIEHSFKKGATKKGEPLVGLAPDITLSRRVQLAVLAHIRHTHTRYDQLLKETTYINARKAVESLCLELLVKWRGDEETGRDQLDEILREVIVISDDEEDDEDEDDSSDVESSGSSEETFRGQAAFIPAPVATAIEMHVAPRPAAEARHAQEVRTYQQVYDIPVPSYVNVPSYARERPSIRRMRRGFKRYQAALDARWDQARDKVRRQGEESSTAAFSVTSNTPADRYEPQYQERHTSGTPIYHGVVETRETRSVSRPSDHDIQATHRIVDYNDYAHPVTSNAMQSNFVYDAHPLQAHSYTSTPGQSASMPRGGFHSRTPSSNSPYIGAEHRPPPPQRPMVRSEQAQDYLVPSVEPTSPATAQPAAPIFVRTVSPSEVPHPRGHLPDEIVRRHDKRHSPSWGGDRHAAGKRRRVLDVEADFAHGSPQPERVYHQHPARDEPRMPAAVSYPREQVRALPLRPAPHERPFQQPVYPSTQPLSHEPKTITERRFYDVPGLASSGHPSQPIVVEDWTRQVSPVAATPLPTPLSSPYPVDSFLGRRETRVVEIRREPHYPYDTEQRRSIPRDYYPVPSQPKPKEDRFARYRQLRDSGPPSPVRHMEPSDSYDPHMPLLNVDPAPLEHPPTLNRHHDRYTEPVSEFVRRAEPRGQPYAADNRVQLDYQYGRDVRIVSHHPQNMGDAWMHHHDSSFRPMQHATPQGQPIYSHNAEGYSQRPPDAPASHSYSTYAQPQYGQPQP